MKRKQTLLRSGIVIGVATLVYVANATLLPLKDIHVGDGEVLDVVHTEEIVTEVSEASETVVVEGTGDAVFWSLTRVVLKPGFRASPSLGGYFHAMVESDSNNDGIPDWWIALHGLGSIHGSDLSTNHNMTYLQVFLYGRDPNVASSGAGMVPEWVAQEQGSTPYNWNVGSTTWVDPSSANLDLSVSQPGIR